MLVLSNEITFIRNIFNLSLNNNHMISEHKLRYDLAMEPVQQLWIQAVSKKRFFFMYIRSERVLQVRSN